MSVAGGSGGSALRCGSITRGRALGAGTRGTTVIGGSALYAEALPRAGRLYLTEVHASPAGTVRFPDFDRAKWREIARDGPHREPGEPHSYSFVTLERI